MNLGQRRYIFNAKTLSYDVVRISAKKVLMKCGMMLAIGVGCFFVYFYIYTRVLGFETPKAAMLEKENKELVARLQMYAEEIDSKNTILAEIQRRDNIVYRPIFGMLEIAPEVREAGFGGIDRYSHLEDFEHSDLMVSTALNMDILTKRACVQSRSFDDVELLAKRAGDMASCVPSISPVKLNKIHITSPFGWRFHPVRKAMVFHEGIDFAGTPGTDIYATGDGVVQAVYYNFFGYGNCVVIDHGFGYKTRYAHLKEAFVHEGDKVLRGERIASLGSSGLSTGPHLHYEVLYLDRQMNPWNFFSNDISDADYTKLVKEANK